jgi:hypothetical protein
MSHVSGPERLPRWAVWRPRATGHRPSRLGVTWKGASWGRWPYAIGPPGSRCDGESCGDKSLRRRSPARRASRQAWQPALSGNGTFQPQQMK